MSIVTICEAATVLGISEQRLRTLCRNGSIAARKYGNTWLLEEESLLSYGMRTSHIVALDHPAYGYSAEKTKPIALSFFSGAMGLDLGIEKAGFDVRLACEIDKYCRQTISMNRPSIALLGDVTTLSAFAVREAAKLSKDDDIDLIVGGPPCQAFSTAGKRMGFHDDRGNVFLRYLDLVLSLRPRYFVIENVRGLLSCPLEHRPHDQRGDGFPDLSADEMKGGALHYITYRIESSGYGYSFNLYNSANFGTPQIRERVIIVCSRDGKTPPFLSPTHSQNGEYGLPKWRTLRDCLEGIETHDHLSFPEKRLRYYRLLKPGQNWRFLPVEMQKEALGQSYYAGGGKTGFLRRLDWDKPSPTLVTHPAMPATDLAHPEENRPLSVQEYKRIQEFPDSWMIAGSLIHQYKQIGNAVPVSLGTAVGRLVLCMINDMEIYQPNNFEYSRYKYTSHSEWKNIFMTSAENGKQKSQQLSLML